MKGELNMNEVRRFMVAKDIKLALIELETLMDLKDGLDRGVLKGKIMTPDEYTNWYVYRMKYENVFLTLARVYGDETAAKMVLIPVNQRIEELHNTMNELKNLL